LLKEEHPAIVVFGEGVARLLMVGMQALRSTRVAEQEQQSTVKLTAGE
jgi:hypothetical protein